MSLAAEKWGLLTQEALLISILLHVRYNHGIKVTVVSCLKVICFSLRVVLF